jgi:hypothetical protein
MEGNSYTVLLRERLVRPEVLHDRVDAVSTVDEARKALLHDPVDRLAV